MGIQIINTESKTLDSENSNSDNENQKLILHSIMFLHNNKAKNRRF